MIGCHYDTRPNADMEPPLSPRRGRFLGANDGASGVALLMELGKRMPKLELAVGVDFVFFDAEEYILDQTLDQFFIGSEHFVKELVRQDKKYAAAVVIDMIADKDLTIHPDQASFTQCGSLVKEIFDVAAAEGVREFNPRPKWEVRDDHEPFLKAGMNACVLIDFDYPHWHRLSDLPKNCSGESMAKVAKVLVAWLKQCR
jgi:Zn-dependent M28 family amino/carboxypeptidase